MAEDAITIALQGESCTISIDPSAYLRVKMYVPGVKPCPLVLQGPSEERSRFSRQTSTTFLLPGVGEKIRIDAYSGDGEGTLLNHTYEREESGLVLKESQADWLEVHIELGAEEAEEKKVCAQCGVEKDIRQFRKVTNQYTGVHPMSICKECYKSNQEAQQRHQEEARETRQAALDKEREAQRQTRLWELEAWYLQQPKLRLSIELVPSSSWGQNLRDLLTQEQWDVLRRKTYKHYGYRCGICHVSNTTLYCHEIWSYDDTNHVQTLTGLIALCKMCHQCKHMGYAGILASRGELDLEQVRAHFLRVNSCSPEAFEMHREYAFQLHEERSRHEWTVDIGKYARLAQMKQEPLQEVSVEIDTPREYPANDDTPPSQVIGQPWLYAVTENPWYPEHSTRGGKWLVFLNKAEVDEVWQLLRLSLAMWRLGDTMKVSIHVPVGKNHVVCVYTYDYADKADVMRIRRELFNLGIRQPLSYKSDEQTSLGLYGWEWGNRVGRFEPIYRV